MSLRILRLHKWIVGLISETGAVMLEARAGSTSCARRASRYQSLTRALLLLSLTSCTQARVNSAQSFAVDPLPRPDIVLVRDFVVNPEDVSVDQGLRARITRQLTGQPLNAEQQEAARQARTAFTQALVARLRSYGLPAYSAQPGAPPAGRVLWVQGQIVSIDEGNRTRRTLIGLGAGASSVDVNAQLLYQKSGALPELLETFTANGDSGHAPGAAETMGAGAAAGRLATSAAVTAGTHGISERRRAGNDDNARRIADALAPQIRDYFASHGWTAPPPPVS